MVSRALRGGEGEWESGTHEADGDADGFALWPCEGHEPPHLAHLDLVLDVLGRVVLEVLGRRWGGLLDHLARRPARLDGLRLLLSRCPSRVCAYPLGERGEGRGDGRRAMREGG